MRLLKSRDYRDLAWKNGLGVSRIIAVSPDGAGYDSLHWQVSITEIGSSCPFSCLPALDRHFMMLEGRGLELECHDEASGTAIRHRIDAALAPVAFSGDWRTECRLRDGPVRILNVVTRRGLADAVVTARSISDRAVLERDPDALLVVFVVSGMVTSGSSGATADAHDAVLVDLRSDREFPVLPVGGGPAQLVEIAIRDRSQ